jgi:hypothetical protein
MLIFTFTLDSTKYASLSVHDLVALDKDYVYSFLFVQ